MPEPPSAPASADARDHAARRLSSGVARQDTGAIAEFYQTWFDWCLRQAGRLTMRDEATCLDVVQNAMLRVVRSLRPMPTHADLERWMTRVVHTAALDLLRSERRSRLRETKLASRGVPPRTSDPASHAELLDQITWVERELDTLSPDDHRFLLARFGLGHTLAGIADAAGTTGGAVHGRLRRALAKLRGRAQEPER